MGLTLSKGQRVRGADVRLQPRIQSASVGTGQEQRRKVIEDLDEGKRDRHCAGSDQRPVRAESSDDASGNLHG